MPVFSAIILATNRIIVTIGEEILVPSSAIGRGEKRSGIIRIDKPTPSRVIIPALEVIQPGLYGTYLAVMAKLSEEELEKTGDKPADFYRPGRGVASPGCDSIART